MSRDRGDGGRYVETITPDEVLGVFERVRGPVVTSADVADHLDCSRETARRKLRELQEEGRVEGRETAGRVVWWRSDRPTDTGIVEDDPLFTAEPIDEGEPMAEDETVDDVVYGDPEA